jgi:glyoxylase-like metal-dependent hydrolase (beta-lactamase superfamily II)
MKHIFTTLSLLAAFVLCSKSTFSQEKDTLMRLEDNLYMIPNLGGNVTFLVTTDGVIVFDAGVSKTNGHKIETYVQSVTIQPIRYLVLTHYHADHTTGACGFESKPIIVGHENLSKNLKQFNIPRLQKRVQFDLPAQIGKLRAQADSLVVAKSAEAVAIQTKLAEKETELLAAKETSFLLPSISFSSVLEIYLGNDTINLWYPGPTHTDCSIFVELKNKKTLIAEDILFNKLRPYIDFGANCDTKNWADQLEGMTHLHYTRVIPGHGPVATPADLGIQAQYLRDLRADIATRFKKGESLEKMQTEIKSEKYAEYGFQHVLKPEIEAIFNEMSRKK